MGAGRPAWLSGALLALFLSAPLTAQEGPAVGDIGVEDIAPDDPGRTDPPASPVEFVPEAPDAADFPIGTPAPAPPHVLIVNLDRIFAESRFGQRVREDLGAAQAALIAENAEIQQRLQAEERSLAERRPEMDVAVFRAEADAFDARVQEIRREQDAKEAQLQQVLDEGRTDFRAAVEPVIARLMVERGASVVLYHTSVYVAVATADITDEAIAALDTALPASIPDVGGDSSVPDPETDPPETDLPLTDPSDESAPATP